MQLFTCVFTVKSTIFSGFVMFWHWNKLSFSLFFTCSTSLTTQQLCKNIFLQDEIGKSTGKSTKKSGPPTVYTLQKFTECDHPVFLWWGLVLHGHMILYFGCTIFAGLEMGTLLARQFLPTLKIFFQKKKQFARLWHELWHPKHPGTPCFYCLVW